MRTYGLSEQQQDQVWEALRAGESVSRIARHHRLPQQHVRRYLGQTGGVRPAVRRRSVRQLTAGEREEVSRGLAAGESLRRIGARLGRSHATISREVARNGGAERYRARTAELAAWERGQRPKVSKLARSPALRAQVELGLRLEWSPQQISNRLRLDFPDDPGMRVSHETIYLCVFQPARKALVSNLHRKLRTGRTMRLPRIARQPQGRGRIRDMVPITDRLPEVETRTIAGDWESQCFCQAAGASAGRGGSW